MKIAIMLACYIASSLIKKWNPKNYYLQGLTSKKFFRVSIEIIVTLSGMAFVREALLALVKDYELVEWMWFGFIVAVAVVQLFRIVFIEWEREKESEAKK